MMDDNLLSQDDIDALMRQMTGEIEVKEEELEDEPKVRPLVKAIVDNACSTLSTLLQRSSDVNFDHLKPGKSIAESELYDSLVAHVGFGKDFDGSLYLAVPKTLTAMMADLMLMGDGNAPFEEDHKDALCEIINNIMGGVNTRMGEEHHTALSISQAEVKNLDTSDSPFKESGSAYERLDVTIEGTKGGAIQILLSKSLYDSVRKYFSVGQANPAVAKVMADVPAAPSAPVSAPAAAPAASMPPSGPPPTSGSEPVQSSDAGSGGGGMSRGLGGSVFASTGNRVLDLLLDIPLNITIELGRTRMSIRKILEMGPGSIIEMDRLIQEPVDLLVNDKVVAKGEVVVVDENFGIRIISLVTPEERIKFLK